MNQHEWNTKQIDEALSAENKYYFWQAYGRPHENVDELLAYYVSAGGAKNFAERNTRPS